MADADRISRKDASSLAAKWIAEGIAKTGARLAPDPARPAASSSSSSSSSTSSSSSSSSKATEKGGRTESDRFRGLGFKTEDPAPKAPESELQRRLFFDRRNKARAARADDWAPEETRSKTESSHKPKGPRRRRDFQRGLKRFRPGDALRAEEPSHDTEFEEEDDEAGRGGGGSSNGRAGAGAAGASTATASLAREEDSDSDSDEEVVSRAAAVRPSRPVALPAGGGGGGGGRGPKGKRPRP